MAVETTSTLTAPYVASDAARLRAAIVFAPALSLAAQPPLHAEPAPIVTRANEQAAVFAGRLRAAGVELHALDAETNDAFSPFGADGAVVIGDGALLMRPTDSRARAAVPALRAALEKLGVKIAGEIEAPGLLDGGDVLFDGKRLYCGVQRARRSERGLPFRTRGNDLGRAQLEAFARAQNLEYVLVETASEVRRLRSVASFVTDDTLLVADGLVDSTAFANRTLIDVVRGEDYAAGSLAIAPSRILTNLRFRESLPAFRKAKLVVDAIDLWEFGKAGAVPSSMVLALSRG